MATNTHIQCGARRRLATMFLLASAIGGGALAGRTALPMQVTSAAPTPQSASAPQSSYGWPVKPFDRQHPVRGSFGDPRSVFHGNPTVHGLMTSRCACSYHQGIDISAPDGSAVYAVRSGVVRIVTAEWVEVDSGGGSAFQYWHIRSAVHVGDRVTERQTVLGQILPASGHVHLTELQDAKPTNPLAPGHIGPYADSTVPRVSVITFRARAGQELLPEYLHGRVEMISSAADTQAIPVPGKWNGLPVTPSKLTFHVETFPGRKLVIPETTARDVSHRLPSTSDMWHTYARGSHMNMVQMGVHRYWYQPGVYLFKLTPALFDTQQLKDGVYQLTATAWDTAGNHSSTSQIVNIHNRKSWLKN